MHKEIINLEIQALRAIAVILVVIHHLHSLFFWDATRWVALGKGLWVGVDMFFCISGFVIARDLLPKIVNTQGNDYWREIGAFWIRRLYRISPSAWLWLALPMALSPLFVHLPSIRFGASNIADIAAAFLHVANLHFYTCTMGGGNCGIFALYWSLSLEEQFYLLLPFVIYFSRKHLVTVLLVLVLVQVFLLRPQWQSLISFIRTDELLLGVLLAIFSNSETYKVLEPKLRTSRLRFFIPPMLLASLIVTTREEVVWFYTGLAALVSTLIVWLCSYNKGYFIGNQPLLKILAWIGERSYAIYLNHIVAFWLVREIWTRIEPEGLVFNGTHTLRFTLTALLLMSVLAELNFRWIENPFRKLGKRYSDRLRGVSV